MGTRSHTRSIKEFAKDVHKERMKRTPTRGNQHGHGSSYKKLKGMALQREYIERKRAKPYNRYVSLLCDIIDKEPSTYKEATEMK